MIEQEMDLGMLQVNFFVIIKSCAMTRTGEQEWKSSSSYI